MTATNDQLLPILIAGGGIGGLATALALARKGRASRVLKQAAEFGEVGAGDPARAERVPDFRPSGNASPGEGMAWLYGGVRAS